MRLVARLGGGLRIRLRSRLRNADVSADGILAYLVDDDLFGNVRARDVEENRFVHGAVLLFETFVFDGHGDAKLIALFVDALELDGNVAHLLCLVLTCACYLYEVSSSVA